LGITETKVLFNLDFLNFTFPLIKEKRDALAQYDKSLSMVKYGKGEPAVPGYYSVRGEVEKAYAEIIN